MSHDIIGKGAYGKVFAVGDVATKATRLFLEDGRLSEACVNELSATALLEIHKLPRVHIAAKVADDGVDVHFKMHRGIQSMEKYVIDTPRADRMASYRTVLVGLVSELSRLHAVGMAHGDMKPANIIFVNRGSSKHIRLIDFGTACMYRRGKPWTTDDHFVVTTHQFAAPEQFDGACPEPATDAYSLGTVLLYYVCQQYLFPPCDDPEEDPFDVQDAVHAMYQRDTGTHAISRRIDELLEGCCVPAPDASIIRRLLDPDPKARMSVRKLHRLMNPLMPLPRSRRDTIIRAPSGKATWSGRADAFRYIAKLLQPRVDSLALACNMADRFVAATGGNDDMTHDVFDACAAISACLVRHYEGFESDRNDLPFRSATARVISSLDHRLLSWTAYDHLVEAGHMHADCDMMLAALVATNTAKAAAAWYIREQPTRTRRRIKICRR